MATLGQRLQAYRVLAGLSQNQLAQRAQVHRPIISEVESGKQANLTLETARRLTQVLGITLEMLAGGDEPEHHPTPPPPKRPRRSPAAPVG
jgi:transcriptional regulator with XRE-family HTH domain